MNTDNGGLHFKIGADTHDFESAIEVIKRKLDEVEEAAEDAGEDVQEALDEAAKEMTKDFEKSMSEICTKIEELTEELNEAIENGNEEAADSFRQQIEALEETRLGYYNLIGEANKYSVSLLNGNVSAQLSKKGMLMLNQAFTGLRQGLHATEVAGTAMWGALTLGISLVIPALIEAFEWFRDLVKDNTEQSDEMQEATAALSLAFDALQVAAKAFGDFIAKSFQLQIQVAKKALLGFKDMAVAVTRVFSDEAADAIEKKFEEVANKVEERKDAIQKERTNDMLQSLSSYQDLMTRQEIDKNRNKAKDTSLSLAERKAALDENVKLISKMADDNVKLTEDKFAKLTQETERLVKQHGRTLKDLAKNTDNWLDSITDTASLTTFKKYLEAQAEIEKIKTQANAEKQRAEKDSHNLNESMKRENEQRRKIIDDYRKSVEQTKKEAEFAHRQSEIDAKEDGLCKSLEQIALNRDQAISNLEDKMQEQVDKIKQMNEELGKRMSEAQIIAEAKAAIGYDQQKQDIDDKSERERKKVLEDTLNQYSTYYEARMKMEREYEMKELEMKEAMQIQANDAGIDLDEKLLKQKTDLLQKEKEEAFAKLSEDYAMKNEEFVAWLEEIADLGIEELEIKLAEAMEELKNITASGEKPTAELEAKVKKLDEAYKKLKKDKDKADKANPNKEQIERYKLLEERLKVVGKAIDVAFEGLEGFSEGWSKTAKKALKAAKDISNGVMQIIGAITQVATQSCTATQTAGETAAEGVKKAEQASVILTIIQAALKIATALFDLFKKESDITEQMSIQYQNEKDAIDMLIDKENELLESRKKYGGSIKEIYQEIAKLQAQSIASSETWYKKNMADWKTGQNSLQAQIFGKKAHGDMAWRNNKEEKEDIFGEDIYKQIENAQDKTQALFDNIMELDTDHYAMLLSSKIWANMQAENSNVTDAIKEAYEANQKLKALEEEQKDALRGFSKDDLKDDLLSYLDQVNMSIDDINGNFDDMVKNIMKRKLMYQLEGEINRFIENMDRDLADETLSPEEYAKRQEEYAKLVQDAQKKWEEQCKAMGLSMDATTEQAKARGIATASQESVDENNGRLAMIQTHTYLMSGQVSLMASNIGLLTENAGDILGEVRHIRIASESMEKGVAKIESNVSYFKDHGMRLN